MINDLLCVTERNGEYIKCECTCPKCGKHLECNVKLEDYKKLLTTDIEVYKVFPYISAAEREMFITGLCNECWEENNIFE